jgi:hypothetical protein
MRKIIWKKFVIIFSLILLVSLLSIVQGLAIITKQIPSSLIINHPKGLVAADFESDYSFRWGVDGGGDYMLYNNHIQDDQVPTWTRGGLASLENPGLLLFEPDTSIVHSSNHSAKLSIVNTSVDSSRRLEILCDWNPYSENIWSDAWFYVPSNLTPLDSWVTFDRLVYERMWNQKARVYYQEFQISLTAMTDTRSATYGQQIIVLNLGKGNIDNNDDGETEIWPHMNADLYSNVDSNQAVPDSWMTHEPNQQLPLDRWFKVTTLVHRNFSDYNNGFVKVWINDKLIWDIEGVRTIGISPDILSKVNTYPSDPQGYLCSGFGLYTSIGSKPKTIYVDDVVISNSSSIMPP